MFFSLLVVVDKLCVCVCVCVFLCVPVVHSKSHAPTVSVAKSASATELASDLRFWFLVRSARFLVRSA